MINSMPASIPQGSNQTCLILEAVDDSIAEYTELFAVSIATENPLDKVLQNMTTVSIVDNDGEKQCIASNHFLSLCRFYATHIFCRNYAHSNKCPKLD